MLPLLDRARNGIEFFGLSERAGRLLARGQGIVTACARLGAFCEFLSDLARCTDYRLLSHVQLQSEDDDAQLDQINAIVSRITADLATNRCRRRSSRRSWA